MLGDSAVGIVQTRGLEGLELVDGGVHVLGSWLVAVDNVSVIPAWWSDALCRMATGDATIKRKLYTDSDVVVQVLQRPCILNAIELPAIKGDLADRVVPIRLEQVPDAARRPESALWAAYEEARPRILGGLFSLMAQVLSVLPSVQLEQHPRMADFARVVAATDEVLGTDALSLYLRSRDDLDQEVLEAEPVAPALEELLRRRNPWQGSPTELFQALIPPPDSRAWPTNAQQLTRRLKQIERPLRTAGINIHSDRGARGKREVTITKQQEPEETPAPRGHVALEAHDHLLLGPHGVPPASGGGQAETKREWRS